MSAPIPLALYGGRRSGAELLVSAVAEVNEANTFVEPHHFAPPFDRFVAVLRRAFSRRMCALSFSLRAVRFRSCSAAAIGRRRRCSARSYRPLGRITRLS